MPRRREGNVPLGVRSVPSQDRHYGGARFLEYGDLHDATPAWRTDLTAAEPRGAAEARLQWRVTQAIDGRHGGAAAAVSLLTSALDADASTLRARLRGSQRLQPGDFWRWVEVLDLDPSQLLSGPLAKNLGAEWRPSLSNPEMPNESAALPVDWPTVARQLAGNVPRDPDAVLLIDDASLAYLTAVAIGLPLSRIRRVIGTEGHSHLIAAHGSASTLVLPVSLGAFETVAEDWPQALQTAYARLYDAAGAHVDEVVAVLALGRRLLDQGRGWRPGLADVDAGQLTVLSSDEFQRLDVAPGALGQLSLSVLATDNLPDGGRLLFGRPIASLRNASVG